MSIRLEAAIAMVEAFIVGYARTPIGKFGGSLKDLPAPILGGIAIRAALERASIDRNVVDCVVMGIVLQSGVGQNPAKQAAVWAGLKQEIPTINVNMVCCSGMMALFEACRMIACGEADVIVAGGMESMSRAPLALPVEARWGLKHLITRKAELIDLMYNDGLFDPIAGLGMGVEADRLAKEYGLTREEADRIAYESHMRAWRATEQGLFKGEIIEVDVEYNGRRAQLDRDEGIRPDTSLEKLARLKPAFTPDGVHTAGNSSQLSDGAAALIVASRRAVEEYGLKPVARIAGYSYVGNRSERFIEAPVLAVEKLLKKTGWSADDVDLFENNEAFAVSSYVFSKKLGVDYGKLNVHGGAIALGHPIGASGARIVATLINALKVHGLKRGIASLCHGTGGATAVALEVL